MLSAEPNPTLLTQMTIQTMATRIRGKLCMKSTHATAVIPPLAATAVERDEKAINNGRITFLSFKNN